MSLYSDLSAVLSAYAAAIKNRYTKSEVDAAIASSTIETDDTLTQEGQAADAKATGDAISEINESLYDGGSEVEMELSFVSGKYINTGGSSVNIGDTIDINNPGTYATMRYAISDCSEGDRFRLESLQGAVSGRAWAFLTSANVLISRSDASQAVNGYVTAPANASKAVFNDNPSSGSSGGKVYKLSSSPQVFILDNLIRFDKSQTLTDIQKDQARRNIGVSTGQGISDDVRDALLACFEKVAWTDTSGRSLYNDLYNALYSRIPGAAYLIATFNSGARTIFTDDPIDSIKPLITVTYYENDESEGVVISKNDYQLSGDLINGNSRLTVTYNDTLTNVTVPALTPVYEYSFANDDLTRVLNKAVDQTGTMAPNLSSNSTRATFAAPFGRRQFNDSSTNVLVDGMYPIAMPANATRAEVTLSPSTHYFAVTPWILDPDTNRYTYLPTEVGWGTTTNTANVNSGNLRAITINIKANSSGTGSPNPTACTVRFY